VRAGPGPITIAAARAAGADPAVFVPVARTQALLVRRRAGILRTRRGLMASWSPFRALCFFALLYGVFGLLFVIGARSRLFGEALAVTIGCLFLLMVVVSDYFDVLVNPREQVLLGPHPHDDRSILLAKLWTVGRALGILCLLLFAPTTIAVLVIEKSLGAAVLYFAGAAGAAAAAALVGLYCAVAVLALFGRRAYDRMMPWVQNLFQLSYFIFVGGQGFVRAMQKTAIPPLVAWLAPPFWFLAPLEGLTSGWTLAVAGRTAVAVALLGALFVGCTRWLGSRVGEKLLEPLGRVGSRPRARSERAPARAAASPGRRAGVARLLLGAEGARFFQVFRVQMRSDWKIRSEFFMGPVVSAFLVLGTRRGMSPWFGMFFLGCFLIVSMDVLTRTGRPESMWCVLVAPVDRARFSASSIPLMRVAQLLPLVLIVAIAGAMSPGTTAWERTVFCVEALLYGDLLILLGRGLFPEFPFTRPSRVDAMSGRRMVLVMFGTLFSSVLTLGMSAASLFPHYGYAIVIASLVALRFPAQRWMRRRVGAAAEDVELASGSVA
jgi:hypothetical protein